MRAEEGGRAGGAKGGGRRAGERSGGGMPTSGDAARAERTLGAKHDQQPHPNSHGLTGAPSALANQRVTTGRPEQKARRTQAHGTSAHARAREASDERPRGERHTVGRKAGRRGRAHWRIRTRIRGSCRELRGHRTALAERRSPTAYPNHRNAAKTGGRQHLRTASRLPERDGERIPAARPRERTRPGVRHGTRAGSEVLPGSGGVIFWQ